MGAMDESRKLLKKQRARAERPAKEWRTVIGLFLKDLKRPLLALGLAAALIYGIPAGFSYFGKLQDDSMALAVPSPSLAQLEVMRGLHADWDELSSARQVELLAELKADYAAARKVSGMEAAQARIEREAAHVRGTEQERNAAHQLGFTWGHRLGYSHAKQGYPLPSWASIESIALKTLNESGERDPATAGYKQGEKEMFAQGFTHGFRKGWRKAD